MVKIFHLQNQNAKRCIEHHLCYKPIKNVLSAHKNLIIDHKNNTLRKLEPIQETTGIVARSCINVFHKPPFYSLQIKVDQPTENASSKNI